MATADMAAKLQSISNIVPRESHALTSIRICAQLTAAIANLAFVSHRSSARRKNTVRRCSLQNARAEVADASALPANAKKMAEMEATAQVMATMVEMAAMAVTMEQQP